MRKVFAFLLGILIISVMGHFFPYKAYADIVGEQDPKTVYINSKRITITLRSTTDVFTGNKYTIGLWTPAYDPNEDKPIYRHALEVIDQETLTITYGIGGFGLNPDVGIWHYKIWSGGKGNLNEASKIYSGEFKMFPATGQGEIGLFSIEMDDEVFKENTEAPIYAKNIDPNTNYRIWFVGEKDPLFSGKFDTNSIIYDDANNWYTATIKINVGKASPIKELCMAEGLVEIYNRYIKKAVPCKYPLQIEVTFSTPSGTPNPVQNIKPGVPTEIPEGPEKPTSIPPLPQCAQWSDLQGNKISEQEAVSRKDIKCVAVGTAVGKISTDPFDFVKSILSILLSLAGGIAVILIIISGYRLMTSQGNPEAVQAARDQLTSAIVGFLFIIFSLVILQVIGVDILKIPGFGR